MVYNWNIHSCGIFVGLQENINSLEEAINRQYGDEAMRKVKYTNNSLILKSNIICWKDSTQARNWKESGASLGLVH